MRVPRAGQPTASNPDDESRVIRDVAPAVRPMRNGQQDSLMDICAELGALGIYLELAELDHVMIRGVVPIELLERHKEHLLKAKPWILMLLRARGK